MQETAADNKPTLLLVVKFFFTDDWLSSQNTIVHLNNLGGEPELALNQG